MSQQQNTYLNMAFAEIEKLKQANEALAARVTELERQAPYEPPAKLSHQGVEPVKRERLGLPPKAAADGTNRQ